MKSVLGKMKTSLVSREYATWAILSLCFFSGCGEPKEPTITEIRDLLDSTHLSEAIQKATKEAEKSGKTDQIHYLRGWIYYLRHQDEAAGKEYNLCLKENPASVDCIRGLARIDQQKIQYRKAETGFKKALGLAELAKDREAKATILTDLGNLALAENKRKEAIDWYTQSIQTKEEGSAYFGLGLAYLLERDKPNAAANLRKGLGVEYKDSIMKAETYYLLARLQFEWEKNPKAAAESAKKAFELFPAREEYAKSWEQYSKAAGSN
ncbi:tetratricopeptide repeat protein [Leptospira wolffii]|uniref:tetratricopeptide repeat protein n=1 Tax=Leptospira wolffii TaxID=409998 RepID=UPI0002FEDEEB|nr:tetratricopeptide repeat protein [Leptospira wolffii]EPG65562.1 tetratricopeptide repeat protein [Leptospira wolffii serovar Khorat str. Khorat-H2]